MEYLKIWTSFAEIIEPLNDSERGRLFTAMLIYADCGELPEFKGNERYVWPIAKQAIDRARAESEKLAANGSKGGRPRKNQEKPNETKENQEKPNESYKDNNKDNNKDNVKENNLTVIQEKRTRFSPPTADEVADYCRERGNHVDPQRFVDFYTAKGWRVGNNPMKDWKAAVRTWEQRDNITPIKQTQTYTQRQYTEADLEARISEL